MAQYDVRQVAGGWAVYKSGRRRFKKTYQTKQDALDAAHRDASKGDSIQGRRVDGTFDNERTKGVYGPDGDR